MQESPLDAIERSELYQSLVEEGVQQGKRQTYKASLLGLGASRFGHAPFAVRVALDLIDDLERLDQMAHRLFRAVGWDDLLDTSQTSPEENPGMAASSTVQYVIEQGREKGSQRVLRQLLHDLGTDRFGSVRLRPQTCRCSISLRILNRCVE